MIRRITEIAENIKARTNLIRMVIEITVNLKEINAMKIKSAENTRTKTRQTHRQAIMIRPTTVTIDARDAIRRRSTGKRILSNYVLG